MPFEDGEAGRLFQDANFQYRTNEQLSSSVDAGQWERLLLVSLSRRKPKLEPNLRQHRSPIMQFVTQRLIGFAFSQMSPSLREAAATLLERDYEAISYGRLANWGYHPAALIDIGAFKGEWSRKARRIFGAVPALMIEAQGGLIPNLQELADAGAAMLSLKKSRLRTSPPGGRPYRGGSGTHANKRMSMRTAETQQPTDEPSRAHRSPQGLVSFPRAAPATGRPKVEAAQR